jgi:glycosyltransferase involved in cell wall biosynthesis
MSHPLVSVIITTYNRPHYLELTLNSVINQTYKNIEVIVVDNGNEDNQSEIICTNFKSLQYIKTVNTKTPAKGRNLGFKKAKGEFIAFLDDDDIWLPNKIEIQVAILLKNSDYGIVHSPCQIINAEGLLQPEIIGESFEWRNKHGDVSLKMLGKFTLMMPTPLVKKEIIDIVGEFNEKMEAAGEDVEFWTRCSFETKFYYYEKPLALYRLHSKNISNNQNAYIDLPLHLKNILKRQKNLKRIDPKQYNLLLKNCIKKQWQYKSQNFFKTIFNLFLINHFWFLKLDWKNKIF